VVENPSRISQRDKTQRTHLFRNSGLCCYRLLGPTASRTFDLLRRTDLKSDIRTFSLSTPSRGEAKVSCCLCGVDEKKIREMVDFIFFFLLFLTTSYFLEYALGHTCEWYTTLLCIHDVRLISYRRARVGRW